MQNLLIDRPSEEEKFEIMKKMHYSFPESSSGRYSLPDLRPMDEVYSDFLKRGDSLIVLRSGEEIVGHVHFGPQIDERLAFGRSGHIYHLFVSDIYRRRGAGKLLLSASLEELKRSSYLTVTANTYRLGAGWSLLKSDGFEEKKICFSVGRTHHVANRRLEVMRGIREDLRSVFSRFLLILKC